MKKPKRINIYLALMLFASAGFIIFGKINVSLILLLLVILVEFLRWLESK